MSDRLEQMRHNPKGNWTIRQILAVCFEHGLTCTPPRGGGSHHKVSHPQIARILTIPSRRPIKPIYIRKFVEFVDEAIDVSGSP